MHHDESDSVSSDANSTVTKAAAFLAGDLILQQQTSGDLWREFLNVQNLSLGIYRVSKGTDDKQNHTPHDRDEVYVGLAGQGCLTADSRTFPMTTNTVVYVKAGVEHHFHDVSEDLSLLVFFTGGPSS